MFTAGGILKYYICYVYDWGDFQVPWGIGGVEGGEHEQQSEEDEQEVARVEEADSHT